MSDPVQPALRHYEGFFADSARWERFTFRPGDVVISTPSKCGTTWMQTIVGMLLLDRVDLGAPISTISPWLDMLTRTEDEVFGLLDAQTHRRFIKTHTPLDGVPRHDEVTYVAVIRHPLDVAMSDRRPQRERARRARDRAARLGRRAGRSCGAPIRRPRIPPITCDGSSTTTSRRPAAVRTVWPTTASRSARTGTRATRQTSTCSTTPTCGPIATARCDGSRPRSASRSTRSVGRRSSRRPGSSRCVSRARRHRARGAHRASGHRPSASSAPAAPATGRRLLSKDDVAHFDERMRLLCGDATDWALAGRTGLPQPR